MCERVNVNHLNHSASGEPRPKPAEKNAPRAKPKKPEGAESSGAGRKRTDWAAEVEKDAAAFARAEQTDALWFQAEAKTKVKAMNDMLKQIDNRIRNSKDTVELGGLQVAKKKLTCIAKVVQAGIDHGSIPSQRLALYTTSWRAHVVAVNATHVTSQQDILEVQISTQRVRRMGRQKAIIPVGGNMLDGRMDEICLTQRVSCWHWQRPLQRDC